jgi:FAS-associated factor 2
MEEEKRQHAQLEHERYLKKRQDYIHYLFHTLSAEPGTDYHGKITKLNFRLANGERVIRKFKETDSIEVSQKKKKNPMVCV